MMTKGNEVVACGLIEPKLEDLLLKLLLIHAMLQSYLSHLRYSLHVTKLKFYLNCIHSTSLTDVIWRLSIHTKNYFGNLAFLCKLLSKEDHIWFYNSNSEHNARRYANLGEIQGKDNFGISHQRVSFTDNTKNLSWGSWWNFWDDERYLTSYSKPNQMIQLVQVNNLGVTVRCEQVLATLSWENNKNEDWVIDGVPLNLTYTKYKLNLGCTLSLVFITILELYTYVFAHLRAYDAQLSLSQTLYIWYDLFLPLDFSKLRNSTYSLEWSISSYLFPINPLWCFVKGMYICICLFSYSLYIFGTIFFFLCSIVLRQIKKFHILFRVVC